MSRLTRKQSRAPINTLVQGGPHEFVRMKRWFNRGRCRHCYYHEKLHPVDEYSPARPMYDARLPV